MKLALITFASTVGVILIGLCMVMGSRNGAISLEEEVNTAKSAIDVHLTTRFNKLHELAGCVRKYDAHEAQTLEKVIAARGKNMSGREAKEVMLQVSAVAEQYPDLKSQKNYQHLMNDISITENHLAQVKKACNESIRDYRYHCRKFPTSLFLDLTGYRVVKFDMYEADQSVKDAKPLELF